MPDACLYPPPPPALERPGLRSLLQFAGPGVIIASVTVGTGELVWASRSGAIFGYGMLWCFLYAGVFKAVQVYTGARYLTLTGEHPMTAWRSLPGPPLWFPLFIALPSIAIMLIAFSGISEILATYIHRLAGMPPMGSALGAWAYDEYCYNVWATYTLVACLALALGSSYTMLERASLVVLLLMAGFFAASAVVSLAQGPPGAVEVASGLLAPRVPATYDDWVWANPAYAEKFATRGPWLEVAVYLTAVGGGAYDYVGYLSMMRGKKWGLAGGGVPADAVRAAAAGPQGAEEVRRARTWIRAPLVDVSASFASVILVTLLCATLGAQMLRPAREIPEGAALLSAQERFLTGLHPGLGWLYVAGVFLAILGTLYGAFEVYRHTALESLRAVAPRWLAGSGERTWSRVVVAYCVIGGLVMVWLPRSWSGDVEKRMLFGSILGGGLASGLWCFAMLWLDGARLPAPLRMGRGLRALTFAAGLGMTALGVQTLWVYLRTP